MFKVEGSSGTTNNKMKLELEKQLSCNNVFLNAIIDESFDRIKSACDCRSISFSMYDRIYKVHQ